MSCWRGETPVPGSGSARVEATGGVSTRHVEQGGQTVGVE